MTGRWRWASVVGVLCLAVSLVVVSAVALNINQLRLRESFQWVHHTDEVLLEVGAVAEDLFAAESSERGYMLVGDDDYARTFRRARETIVGRMDSLAALVADNQRQNENLALLRPAMQARLDELVQVVELGPARLDAALAVVRSGKSRQLTALIQDYLTRFRRVELELLRERQERAEHDTLLSTMLALATTILALLSATLGLFLFQRARSEHREAVLRTELIHVSRLNTMGQMASMLAHELNQPLTATANYLRAMLRMTDAADPVQSRMVESLRRSGAQMERAREIVQRLRRFIEKGEPSRSAEEIGPMSRGRRSPCSRCGTTPRRCHATSIPVCPMCLSTKSRSSRF